MAQRVSHVVVWLCPTGRVGHTQYSVLSRNVRLCLGCWAYKSRSLPREGLIESKDESQDQDDVLAQSNEDDRCRI